MTKNTGKNTKPIRTKEEVAQNPDERIDEDFPGFPHAPSKEEVIKPKTRQEKLTADVVKNKKHGK